VAHLVVSLVLALMLVGAVRRPSGTGRSPSYTWPPCRWLTMRRSMPLSGRGVFKAEGLEVKIEPMA
jgi:hypothetical protein